MSPDDATHKLNSLSARQIEVLKQVCEGLSYKQIAINLFISENTVKTHMTNIYTKLGLDEFESTQQRKIALHQTFCTALQGIETPPKKSDEPKELPTVPEKVWKMVEEDEKAIILRPSYPIIDIESDEDPPPPPKRTKRLRWFLFGVVVGSILMASVVYFSWKANLFLNPEAEISSLDNESQNPITPDEQSANPEASVTPIQNRPVTPESQTTQEVEVVETEAIISSAVLPLPFTDNFDQGLSDDWQQILGTWRMVDGKLTADQSNSWSLILVGDDRWQDYAIDMDILSSKRDEIRIILRAKGNSYIAFETSSKLTSFGSNWILFQDGVPNTIAHTDTGGLNGGTAGYLKSHFRIEVQDDIYKAFSDGVLISQIQEKSLTSGEVGISLKDSSNDVTLIDNFVISVLP